MSGERSGVSELERVRASLRRYGTGWPQFQTEAAFREWLATLGRRFACHFTQTTGKRVRCHGWGLLHRRGGWMHPLTFKVGRAAHTFYVSLTEMRSLYEAHPDHALVISETLYRWLEEVLGANGSPSTVSDKEKARGSLPG